MDISIINQRLGIENLYENINKALKSKTYDHFYVLVAYISWAGIDLIHEELEKFYDKGGRVSFIIGVADNSTEYHVLKYLKDRLPKAQINIFYAPGNFEFHPKMYFFKGKNDSQLFIGSNNLTNGGLNLNSECCAKINFKQNIEPEMYASVMKVWATYGKPNKPFYKSNIKKVDNKFLLNYSKCVSKKKSKSNSSLRKSLSKLFPKVNIPLNAKHKLNKKIIKNEQPKKIVKGRIFLLEVKKETGAGGTQVQLPIEAINEFFNVEINKNQTIEVQVNSEPKRPAVICHFKNHTHRISFNEIIKFNRPLIIKFMKISDQSYKVSFVQGALFKKLIKKCKNQIRIGAKKWVIY